jgi:hypothetical protein
MDTPVIEMVRRWSRVDMLVLGEMELWRKVVASAGIKPE